MLCAPRDRVPLFQQKRSVFAARIRTEAAFCITRGVEARTRTVMDRLVQLIASPPRVAKRMDNRLPPGGGSAKRWRSPRDNGVRLAIFVPRSPSVACGDTSRCGSVTVREQRTVQVVCWAHPHLHFTQGVKWQAFAKSTGLSFTPLATPSAYPPLRHRRKSAQPRVSYF